MHRSTYSTKRQSHRLWRVGLWSLALFTLVRCLVWAVVNPPFNSGDETAHLMYAMQVRVNGSLPVFEFGPDCLSADGTTPPDSATAALVRRTGYSIIMPYTAQPYESYQPPLYYLMVALAASPLPLNDALGTLYAARVVSAVLATATVIVAAYAFRELTRRPSVALACAALLTSIPTFGFFGGVGNNDSALNLFAAASVLVMLRTLRTPGAMIVPGSLLLGAMAGAGLVSKASALTLVPVGLLTLLLVCLMNSGWDSYEARPMRSHSTLALVLRKAVFWRHLSSSVGLYALAFSVVAGWWMVGNLNVYGDLTGTANQIQYGAQCWGPTILSQGVAGLPRYLMSLALGTPFSFMTTFGWGESIGSMFYYAVILPLLLLDVYIALRRLSARLRGLHPAQQAALLVMVTLVLATTVTFISFNFTIQYQPVGRYLYMAMLPVAGFLSIGLLLATANRKLNLAIFVAALAGLNALTLGGYFLAGTGYIATLAAANAPH